MEMSSSQKTRQYDNMKKLCTLVVRPACLSVPACLRAGADTAVGQAGWNFIQKSITDFGPFLLLTFDKEVSIKNIPT